MTDLDSGADLRERIDRALTDLSAPDGLTEAALARGHRLRRRRRVLTTASGVAAVAVVAALVVPGLDGGRTGSGPEIATQLPASPSADDQPSPNPQGQTPSPGPDDPGGGPFPEPPEGWWSMPASTIAKELAALLPDGVRLTDAETMNTDRAPGEPKRELTGYLTAVLRPAEGGPGKINVVFYAPPTGELAPPPQTDANGNVTEFGQGPTSTQMTTCDPEWITRPKDCTELTAADGSTIGRVLDSTVGQVRSLGLWLRTEDGGVVMFDVANTLDDKWPNGATASADDVPLELPTLRSLAEDPVWTSYTP